MIEYRKVNTIKRGEALLTRMNGRVGISFNEFVKR